MEEVKVSTKGQIVIPKYIRDSIGIKPGNIILVAKTENRIVLIPKPDDPVASLEKAGEDLSIRNIRREIKTE